MKIISHINPREVIILYDFIRNNCNIIDLNKLDIILDKYKLFDQLAGVERDNIRNASKHILLSLYGELFGLKNQLFRK